MPRFVLLLAGLTLSSCNQFLPSGCAVGTITGMVQVSSAKFDNGVAISEVRFRNVKKDGVSISAQEALGQSGAAGGQLSNVRVENDVIVCTVACSFAAPGRYTFTAEATGAVPQELTVNIPPRSGGGCGGITTGTPVKLNLVFELILIS